MTKIHKILLTLAVLAIPSIMIAHPKSHNHGLFGLNTGQNATHSPVMAKTTNLHLNKEEIDFNWDSSVTPASHWQFNLVHYYSYDVQGRVILNLQVDTTTADTSQKTMTAYDVNGSVFNSLYSKSSGTWQLSEVDTTLYDNKGLETRNVNYYLNSGSLQLVGGSKYILTYDGSGNMTKRVEVDFNSSTNTWANYEEIDIISNADGSWKTYTQADWNGTGFVNTQRVDSFTWNKWGGNPYANGVGFKASQPSKFVNESWNGSAWVDSSHTNITYDANGGTDQISQVLTGGKWVNSERDIQTLDSKGNGTSYVYETWDGTKWVLNSEDKSTYTYDANGNIMQIIYQYYDQSISGYRNTEKIVYGEFETITGISAEKQSGLAVNIYPNPASDNLHLQANTNAKGNVAVMIFNIQGQMVMQSRYTSEELSAGLNLSIQGLHSGIYILHIVSDQIDTVRKFNVQ